MGPLTVFFFWAFAISVIVALIALFADSDDALATFTVTAIASLVLMIGTYVWDQLDNPRAGTAISKEFVEEHWSMCGKVPCYIEDKWYVTLLDGSNEGTIEVSHREYDTITIGSRFVGE